MHTLKTKSNFKKLTRKNLQFDQINTVDQVQEPPARSEVGLVFASNNKLQKKA